MVSSPVRQQSRRLPWPHSQTLSTFVLGQEQKLHAPSKARHVLYSTEPWRSRFSWCHHSILLANTSIQSQCINAVPRALNPGLPHCSSTLSVTRYARYPANLLTSSLFHPRYFSSFHHSLTYSTYWLTDAPNKNSRQHLNDSPLEQSKIVPFT